MLSKRIKIIPFRPNHVRTKPLGYSFKIKFMHLYHAFCLKEKELRILEFESAETCLRKLLKQGFDHRGKNEAVCYSVVRADQNSTPDMVHFSPSNIANFETNLPPPTFAQNFKSF
jgi:hypothetical protein